MKSVLLTSLLLIATTAAQGGCGGNGGGGENNTNQNTNQNAFDYAVGGTVTGLSGLLVLELNGDELLALNADGTFAFDTLLADGASYDVIVSAQPDSQSCTLTGSQGTVDGSDVTTVAVSCGDLLRVVSTSPGYGQEGLEPDTRLSVEFSGAIDPASLSVQTAWGPCDTSASLHISADDFSTCVGGDLDTGANPVATFTPRGGVWSTYDWFQIRVTTGVTDPNGQPLAEEHLDATGFSVIHPPCTGFANYVDELDTGAVCDVPQLVNNGDGTITDGVNRLLWTRCGLDASGQPADDGGGGCAALASGVDVHSYDAAVQFCEGLTYAGRSDWTLPGVARLETLVDLSSVPNIDATSFPSTPAGRFWSRTTTDFVLALVPLGATAYVVDFADAPSPRVLPQLKEDIDSTYTPYFVRCVARGRPVGPPVLSVVTLEPDPGGIEPRIRIHHPQSTVDAYPTASVQAYIGLDGVIGAIGSTITGNLGAPADVTAGPFWFEQPAYGMTIDTLYRVMVVAENVHGFAIGENVAATGAGYAVPPYCNPLEILSFSSDRVRLAQPVCYGWPSPAVNAWIGLDGTIAANPTTGAVTGATLGPVDVSSSWATFYVAEGDYRIIVVADNGAIEVSEITQTVAAFIDHGDGTVFQSNTNLVWSKCASGMYYDSGTGFCNGVIDTYQYCSDTTNDCNQGTGTGILGPPFTNGASSSVYNVCLLMSSAVYAGRSNWRVPSADELADLWEDFDPGYLPGVASDESWWARDSHDSTYAYMVMGNSGWASTKTDSYPVRCVSTGP